MLGTCTSVSDIPAGLGDAWFQVASVSPSVTRTWIQVAAAGCRGVERHEALCTRTGFGEAIQRRGSEQLLVEPLEEWWCEE